MDPTTNTLNVGDSTLTIRVIKSFPYRTVKPFIARHLDLEKVTVGDLKELTKKGARPSAQRLEGTAIHSSSALHRQQRSQPLQAGNLTAMLI